MFGRAIPKLEVEALTWTLSLATDRPLPKPVGRPAKAVARPGRAAIASVLDPASGRHDERPPSMNAQRARPGMSLDGPALIVEDGTTTVVPQGFRARINAPGPDRAGGCDMSTPADIRLQVMWNRLLSVVEEQARALVRTAFSTSAREAGDISAGVFDLEGRCWPRPSPARRAT